MYLLIHNKIVSGKPLTVLLSNKMNTARSLLEKQQKLLNQNAYDYYMNCSNHSDFIMPLPVPNVGRFRILGGQTFLTWPFNI